MERWGLLDGRTIAVREGYYVASCDDCGWVGSSEECGADTCGDDSDVYCPKCQTSGADMGKLAETAVFLVPFRQDQTIERLIARADDWLSSSEELSAESLVRDLTAALRALQQDPAHDR